MAGYSEEKRKSNLPLSEDTRAEDSVDRLFEIGGCTAPEIPQEPPVEAPQPAPAPAAVALRDATAENAPEETPQPDPSPAERSEPRASEPEPEGKLDAVQASVDSMAAQMKGLDAWMQSMDAQMKDAAAWMQSVDAQLKDLGQGARSAQVDASTLSGVRESLQEQSKLINRSLNVVERFRQDTLNGLQRDNERYKKRESGEYMLSLLKPLARTLAQYEFVIDQAQDARLKNNLRSLFEEIQELMAEYNVAREEPSKPRTKLNVRTGNRRHVMKTTDPELHGCVARSVTPAYIMRDPDDALPMRVLCQEVVDIYAYAENPQEVLNDKGSIHAVVLRDADVLGCRLDGEDSPLCVSEGRISLRGELEDLLPILPAPVLRVRDNKIAVLSAADAEDSQGAQGTLIPSLPTDPEGWRTPVEAEGKRWSWKKLLTALMRKVYLVSEKKGNARFLLVCPPYFDADAVEMLREAARDAGMNVLAVLVPSPAEAEPEPPRQDPPQD